jgi:hypothetical protein
MGSLGLSVTAVVLFLGLACIKLGVPPLLLIARTFILIHCGLSVLCRLFLKYWPEWWAETRSLYATMLPPERASSTEKVSNVARIKDKPVSPILVPVVSEVAKQRA